MPSVLLNLVLLVGATAEAPSPKVYEVRHLAQSRIVLDGQANETAWKEAVLETGFTFPWQQGPVPSTRFRALCDDETLYFLFEVHDEDLVVLDALPDEQALAGEDRVEIFLASDLELKNYYCLEMDPRGRTLDYQARLYRQFDNSWSLAGLKLKTTVAPQGYTVEGSLPLKTLSQLGLPALESGRLRVGLFRAEFRHGPTAQPVEGWLSWVDPHMAQPDFHVPAAFGTFKRNP